MTFETGVHIAIGNYTFSRCNEVVVDKSTAIVQDTARIKLPLTARVKTGNDPATTIETAKVFKVGDEVIIRLSYLGHYDAIQFKGFVKRIHPGQPLEIECEDAIWKLRQKNIKKSWKKTTLNEVLNEIVSGSGISIAGNIPSINLEPFGLQDVDGAFALQKLADEYGLRAYIKNDGSLWCGLAYSESEGTVKYNINGDNSNVVSANDLKWRDKDEVKIKVKAINIKGDNTRTEVEVGDEDGALRTLNFYNISSQDELTKLASQKLDELKFDGYEGKITTLLIPEALPGMTAELTDSLFPERGGSYYVESVKTKYGTSGARREVELGMKL
jgi:phage protein D